MLRVFTGADGGGGNPLGVILDGAAVPAAQRQALAAVLGFSETVFVDDAERGELRIFTPGAEVAFAGHPSVGAAWPLGVDSLLLPAGEVPVRHDGELTWIAGRAEWAPPFEHIQAGSPEEVDALSGAEGELPVARAWEDEAAGRVRARVFPVALGIAEDESHRLRRHPPRRSPRTRSPDPPGQGSLIHRRPLEDGWWRSAGAWSWIRAGSSEPPAGYARAVRARGLASVAAGLAAAGLALAPPRLQRRIRAGRRPGARDLEFRPPDLARRPAQPARALPDHRAMTPDGRFVCGTIGSRNQPDHVDIQISDAASGQIVQTLEEPQGQGSTDRGKLRGIVISHDGLHAYASDARDQIDVYDINPRRARGARRRPHHPRAPAARPAAAGRLPAQPAGHASAGAPTAGLPGPGTTATPRAFRRVSR